MKMKKANGEFQGFSNERMKKNRIIALMIGLSVLAIGAFIVLLVAFPRLFHQRRFVSLDLAMLGDKPLIVSLWSEEFSSEDDGTSLRGYEVRAHDPQTHAELSKIYLERSLDLLPSDPLLHVRPDGDVWVVQPQNNAQPTSFMQRLKLSSTGQFKLQPTPMIADYIPATGFQGSKITLRNQFHEVGCFDAETETLVEQNCPWETPKSIPGTFFLVSKTSVSTRSKLWRMQTDSVGVVSDHTAEYMMGIRSIDDVYVLQDLAANQFMITEERFSSYPRMTDTPTFRFSCLTRGDYLVDAKLIYQDSMQAILQIPTADPQVSEVACIDGFGEQAWKIKVDFANNLYATLQVRPIPGKTVLIVPESFVIAIDLDAGQVAWEYRP